MPRSSRSTCGGDGGGPPSLMIRPRVNSSSQARASGRVPQRLEGRHAGGLAAQDAGVAAAAGPHGQLVRAVGVEDDHHAAFGVQRWVHVGCGERQEDGLAAAVRPEDQGVADIADMRVVVVRGGADGAQPQQRRAPVAPAAAAGKAGHRRERDQVVAGDRAVPAAQPGRRARHLAPESGLAAPALRGRGDAGIDQDRAHLAGRRQQAGMAVGMDGDAPVVVAHDRTATGDVVHDVAQALDQRGGAVAGVLHLRLAQPEAVGDRGPRQEAEACWSSPSGRRKAARPSSAWGGTFSG